MKTIAAFLLILGLIIITSPLAHSQDKPNQISVGYGVITIDEELDLIEDVIGSFISIGTFKTDNTQMSGAAVFTYNHALSDIVHLGGAFAYETITEDVLVADSLAGDLKRQFYTLAAESRFTYIHGSFFQMYSGVGAGITFNTDTFEDKSGNSKSENQTHFNFQLNLLGLRVGNSFAGYAELGYGYKGIVNFGLSIRF